MVQLISSLSDISHNYKALFVDLWGCVHNGITAYPAAVAALQKYRAQGGVVVLVTNSPRPRKGVIGQLADFGVPADAYDTIATSGDSARAALFTGAIGSKVYFMGDPQRDAGFFEPLNVIQTPLDITRVPLAQAEGIVCCGPFDPMADLDVNKADLLLAKTNGLKLLCANPDIIVDRGEEREWCAGAIAKMYTDMGGESLYFGKPHPPIYDLARRRLAEIGHHFDDADILAIGDGPHTDISGAMGEGLESLFISGGLAATETKTAQDPASQPDPAALESYLAQETVTATYGIGFLR